MQLDKIEELVAAGEAEGAEIYQPPCRLPEKGYWFVPTVFTNVAQSYRIAQEEIFGPVLSVLTFRTPDEAIEKANNTPYGLSAGVWTEKGSRILWMAERLRAGVVWANTFNRFDPTSPFGGYKESGFGREGGLHGLEPYLDFDAGASQDALPVKKTYKLYHRRRVPAQRVGTHVRGAGPERRACVAQGRARRGAGGARRAAEVGVGDGVQPRPGALPDRRDDGGAPAGVRRALQRQGRGRALDRPLGLVRRLRRQAGAGDRLVEPGRRARTSTSRSPSRPASSASSRPTTRRCSVSSRGSRPRSPAATRSSRSRPRRSRSRRSSWPRRSRRATCPAASSTCSPASAPSSRRGSRATWT